MADDKQHQQKTEADRKAEAEKRTKEVQERTAKAVAQAYEHETPTPTQAENDAAMLAATNQQELPEGSGLTPATRPATAEEQQKRKTVEGQNPGGYQTRASGPAHSRSE